MPVTGTAIGASAAIGGLSSFFGGKAAADASTEAARLQAQVAREAIAAQRASTREGFGVFATEASKAREFLRAQTELASRELAPLKEIGLINLRRASGFADPNSSESQSERDAFQRVLSRNLSARGLTASGTEIAGLSDFELGLARERRNIALGLAGQGANALSSLSNLQQGLGQGLAQISQNLGSQGASLFSTLGGNIGQTLMASGQAQGNLLAQAGQQRAQGLIGVGNAFQTGILGLGQLYSQQNALAQQNALMNRLFGGGGLGGPVG